MKYNMRAKHFFFMWGVSNMIACNVFQKLVIAPVKKELGLAFKGSQKNVVEALEVSMK